jgi:hypothetical protein
MENTRDEKRLRKCAHEPCWCRVQPTEEYCGAHCSTADNVQETELQCDCGHDSCTLN